MKTINAPKTILKAIECGISCNGKFKIQSATSLQHADIYDILNTVSKYWWHSTGFFSTALFNSPSQKKRFRTVCKSLLDATGECIEVDLYEMFHIKEELRNTQTLVEFQRLFECFKEEATNNLDAQFVVLSHRKNQSTVERIEFHNMNDNCQRSMMDQIKASHNIQHWLEVLSSDLRKFVGVHSWNTFTTDCVLTLRETSLVLRNLEQNEPQLDVTLWF